MLRGQGLSWGIRFDVCEHEVVVNECLMKNVLEAVMIYFFVTASSPPPPELTYDEINSFIPPEPQL